MFDISTFILISLFFIVSLSPSFPTFAILSIPVMEKVGEGKFKSTKERIEYTLVRWLQASGAEVIAIHTYTPKKELNEILEKVNGVILPGDNIKTELEGAYYNQAKKIYNKVIEMYNESQGKIKIPLLTIGNDVTLLGTFASEMSHFIESLMQIWPNEVSFLNNTLAKNSIMFSELDEKDFRSMDFLHLVVNDLKFILSFAEFQNSYHLKNAYDVIAHSFCLYGRNYVSALQSKEFPITGVTFRPEAIAFEQSGKVETSVGHKDSQTKGGLPG